MTNFTNTTETLWHPDSDPVAVECYRKVKSLMRRILLRHPWAGLDIVVTAFTFTDGRPTLEIAVQMGEVLFPLETTDQTLDQYFADHPPVKRDWDIGVGQPQPSTPRDRPTDPLVSPGRLRCPVCGEEVDDPEEHEGRH